MVIRCEGRVVVLLTIRFGSQSKNFFLGEILDKEELLLARKKLK